MAVEARNRKIEDWFTRIRTGQITLPRFQRFEAWAHKDNAALLETVIRGLPCGATLVLEVGAHEEFESRYMESAPAGAERVVEQLLDGQQRLTALWRALHDNYEDRTYLLHWRDDEDSGDRVPEVLAQSRWSRNGTCYPVWCDDAAECWRRGYFPVRLLNPAAESDIRPWTEAATSGDLLASRDIETTIRQLRTTVANYNVPYLGLPSDTPKYVALDVFIKMNTSAARLTPFDVVVAQLEAATGQSLHELVDDLRAAVPGAARYDELGDLVLNVAAMRENRSPSQASYQRLDLKRVADEWVRLVSGIRWAVQLLEDEHVYDAARLPSVAVLPILAAIHEYAPESLDGAGNARTLARAFLWRAFLTSRYELAASSRSLQDLRGLRDALTAGKGAEACSAPIFDTEQTPLPTERDLRGAGWPKRRETLARGVLAVALRHGGCDMADGQPARPANLGNREYHHLFPDNLLVQVGGLEEYESFRALNCALITWSTNRNISNKSPLQYLEDRVNRSSIGEVEIRSRLRSHLVPYEALAEAGPYTDGDGARIQRDYSTFMDARTALVLPAALRLCEGRDPQ